MASKIYKNSVVYVALGFLAPGVNFFLLPFYTKLLSTSEFGIITLATILQYALSNLTGLGLNGAFNRLFFDYEAEAAKAKSLFSSAFFLQIGSGVLVHFILLALGDRLLSALFKNEVFTYSRYGIFIGVTAIAGNLQTLILGWYRNKEDLRSYSIWAVFFFLAQATGIFIGIIVYHAGALGNIEGRMWGSLLPLATHVLIRYRMFRFKKDAFVLSRSMLAYGLPLVPYTLISMAYNNVDKILLERSSALSTLGLYGFAFMIFSTTEIFLNALQSATYPTLFRELKNETRRPDKIYKIYFLFIVANLLIVVLLASFSGFIIDLVINRNYHPVISYLPLLLLAAIPRTFSIIFSNTLFFYTRTKVMPVAGIISFIAICLTGLFLIPRYGVFGAVVSVFVSQTVQLLVFIFFNIRFKIITKESTILQKEYMLAGIVIITTTGAAIAYNFISESLFWFLGILLAFFITLYAVFKKIILEKGKNLLELFAFNKG